MTSKVHDGDLFDVLPTVPDASIDACVTDPPYGIGFMGREWDTFKPGAMKESAEFRQVDRSRVDHPNPNLRNRARSPALSPSQIDYDYSAKGLRGFQEWSEQWAREVFRVLKPGAHLLVCGAPRSFHRMTCGLEDAGFVVRDCFSWLYGQGFPKSLNLGAGQGTALKPGWEPIVLARKPMKSTVAQNIGTHGTGALNIDACRIAAVEGDYDHPGNDLEHTRRGRDDWRMPDQQVPPNPLGRWPANVLLDEEAAALLDEQTGELTSGSYTGDRSSDKFRNVYGVFGGQSTIGGEPHQGSVGGVSRFYYVAKPSREERDYGCLDLELKTAAEITGRKPGSAGLNNPRSGIRAGSANRDEKARIARNIHPTVKPIELMRWLVRLVTPIGGTVLDPFTGSGTTGMACRYEQRAFIGIEREAEYVQIAERRIAAVAPLFANIERGAAGGTRHAPQER